MSRIIDVLTDTGFLAKVAGGLAIYVLGLLKNPWKSYKTWKGKRTSKLRETIIHAYILEVEPSGFVARPGMGLMKADYNMVLTNKTQYEIRINHIKITVGGGNEIDTFEDTKSFTLKPGEYSMLRYDRELNEWKCKMIENCFGGHPGDLLHGKMDISINSTYKKMTVNSWINKSVYLRVNRG